jgi:hypothetical protein
MLLIIIIENMSIDKIRSGLSNIKRHNICIRSQDRLIGVSLPTNFTVDLGVTFNDIVMYEVQKITFPFTYYVINNNNNIFRYTDTGPTARTITIPEGEYDIVNLLRQITSQMTSTSSETYDFELTYQNPNFNLNRKSIIRNELGQSFSLNFSGTTNSVAKVLGYDNIEYTGSSIFTAPNDPNFNEIENLIIRSDALTVGRYDEFLTTNTASNITNVLWKFGEANNDYGDIITETPLVEERAFRTNISSLREIDISIYNDRGQIIDTNGFDINLCIILYTRENNNNFVI